MAAWTHLEFELHGYAKDGGPLFFIYFLDISWISFAPKAHKSNKLCSSLYAFVIQNMKNLFRYLSLGLVIPTAMALADAPRQECLGRTTFDVPEDMQWATYDGQRTDRITDGWGGHIFTPR